MHGREHLLPIALLFGKLRAAGAGEGIDLDAAPVALLAPFAGDPVLLRQAVQRGEEGTGADYKNAPRYLFDAIGNGDAVQRTKLQRAEDEQVERPLQKFSLGHGMIISAVDIGCQYLAAQAVQVRRTYVHTHELQVGEKLILVVDQVFQVSQEQGEQRLAIGYEDGGQLPAKISVGQGRESLVDVARVEGDALAGFAGGAEVIHWKVAQGGEVAEALGIGCVQHGTEARQAVEQVAQEVSDGPCTGNGGRPLLVRQAADEVDGAFDLFVDFG